MKNFQNKVVVITGAGSGIGRALAVHFSTLGARLALNDYKADTLTETIALIEKNTDVYQEVFDVSVEQSVQDFATNVMNHFGQVDVVINNAGVAIAKLMTEEVSMEEYDWIMGINLWGVMYGTLAFLPHLRQQKEASVVNISSVFGILGIPGQAAYCTTKFAVRGFTESLAWEEQFNQSGVCVSCVHPGGIKTNIARNSLKADLDPKAVQNFEKLFITSSEKAAKTIIKGIQKKRARILIGPDAHLIWLISKLPRFFSKRFLATMMKKQEF